MIYTGSLFEKERWIGKPRSISQSQPKGKKVKEIPILAPSKDLIFNFWNKSAKDESAWEDYKSLYKEELKGKWSGVVKWLDSLTPQENLTLLCWEKDSDKEFRCHRQLVNKIIEKFRPDCYWLNAPVAPTDRDKWNTLQALDLQGYEVSCLSIFDNNGKPSDDSTYRLITVRCGLLD